MNEGNMMLKQTKEPLLKLTKERIEELCETAEYFSSGTLTICVITLSNGGQVTGTSNVICPETWNEGIGKHVAYENAKGKIWELEGYAMKTRDLPLIASN
jgi:hypothetical protein